MPRHPVWLKSVDQNGCALYQTDTDNDGISDDIDICPNTAQGATVDNSGAPNNKSTQI